MFTGTQALSFPHLTLILSLFTRNDYSYFCGRVKKARCRGYREEVLIIILCTHPLPSPGDPTCKVCLCRGSLLNILFTTRCCVAELLSCSFFSGSSFVEFSLSHFLLGGREMGFCITGSKKGGEEGSDLGILTALRDASSPTQLSL